MARGLNLKSFALNYIYIVLEQFSVAIAKKVKINTPRKQFFRRKKLRLLF